MIDHNSDEPRYSEPDYAEQRYAPYRRPLRAQSSIQLHAFAWLVVRAIICAVVGLLVMHMTHGCLW
jgi:hypothetical protein